MHVNRGELLTGDASQRASDADRERIATLLRDHVIAGRLTISEFEDRLSRVYGGTTVGELRVLLDDLQTPASGVGAIPFGRLTGALSSQPRLTAHMVGYLAVMVTLVAIWAATGAGYFWPIWPGLGWGIGIASKVVRTQRREDRPTP